MSKTPDLIGRLKIWDLKPDAAVHQLRITGTFCCPDADRLTWATDTGDKLGRICIERADDILMALLAANGFYQCRHNIDSIAVGSPYHALNNVKMLRRNGSSPF